MARKRRDAAGEDQSERRAAVATTSKRAQRVAAPSPANDALAEVVDDEPDHGGDEESDDDVLQAEIVDDDELIGGAVEPEIVEDFALPAKSSSDASSLARYDALQAYMRDVHRYSVLDAESQRQLAVRYRESGDLEAAAQLVTSWRAASRSPLSR